ncbi:MAG: hypothetical protein AABZ47_14100 [Planctomycetota bacterium]
MKTNLQKCRARWTDRRNVAAVVAAFALTVLIADFAWGQSGCKSFKIESNPRELDDQFGFSVAIDGDLAVVGAPFALFSEYGLVIPFHRNDGGTPGDLLDDTWTQGTSIFPNFPKNYTPFHFGASVAVSGDFIAVADPLATDFTKTVFFNGAVQVFERFGAIWLPTALIQGPGGDDADSDELTGTTVAMDGDLLVIGAPNNRDAGPASGAAYVFERVVNPKVPYSEWVKRVQLLAPGGSGFESFGTSVAISGDFVVVGATEEQLDPNPGGAAYVFRRTGLTTWVPDGSQGALRPAPVQRYFGNSVAIDGTRVVVGARSAMTMGVFTGAAYVFERTNGATPSWIQATPVLVASDAADNDGFGWSVAIRGEDVVVGAPQHQTSAGSAYLFRRTESGWVQRDRLGTLTTPPFRRFGESVAMSDTFSIVGAPFNDGAGSAFVLATADSDDDGISDACEGFGLGEELPAPPGGDPFRTSQTANSVQPATRAFYYNNVYPTAPTGRFFASQEGLVTISWRDVNGNPVGDVPYLIGRDVAGARPGRPYDVKGVRYFKEWTDANVLFGTSSTLSFRYNGLILQDGDAGVPGNQPHVQRLGNVLDVAANCPEGAILLQYTDGPNGRLAGFEVLNILNLGSPPGLSVSIGRRLPTPTGEPPATYCRAVVVANASTGGVTVGWQRPMETTDVFPIRDEFDPSKFAVAWYQESPFENCWPIDVNRYITTWPADPAQHAVLNSTPDTALVDLGIGDQYCGATIMYQKGFTAPIPTSSIVNGMLKVEREGYTVIRFDSQSAEPGAGCGSEVHFEVVASYDHRTPRSGNTGVYAGESAWDIGTQLTDMEHDADTPGFPFGYHQSGQAHSLGIYDETGQIFPINSSDIHGVLEAWWFRESIYAPGTFWPHKVETYFANWPAARGEDDDIVIASRLGAGSYPPGSVIYNVGNPLGNPLTEPGWNPNDEHAVLLPIAGSLRAFAARDDNPRNALSGHPFVLVQYHPPGSMLWNMGVHRVVGERPPNDFDYDAFPSQADPTVLFPVVAGQPIDPLFPVNLGAALCFTNTVPPNPFTLVVGDALWVDRSAGIWAVEETTDTFPPVDSFSTVYLYENWSDGGCQPWRSFYNGGNGMSPWPIVYRPGWPETPPACNYPIDPACARPLQVGESVNVSGQCGGIAVLHDSVDLRVLDPSHDVFVNLVTLPTGADLEKLPPHLVAGEIAGGGELLPDRVRHFDGRLHFRGVMSGRDREYLHALSADAAFRNKVNDLFSLSRDQLIFPVAFPLQKVASVAHPNVIPGWLTLGFQNDRACDPLPVSAEVWRIDCPPDQSSIRVIQPTCPFNEKQVLQFSGDAGGEPESLVYHWQWSTSEEGPWTDYAAPLGPAGCTDQFQNCYRHGVGIREVVIEGASPFTLADSWWRVRLRGYPGCQGNVNPDPTQPWPPHLNNGGNTQISEWTQPQLAEGWVKRVIRGLNPFDQRVSDFHSDEIATYVSMIQQAGMRFEEPVPLNCTPSNINRLGLIEVYETVLRRARQFSIDQGLSYDPANLAILLVASKIADLYMLLGNEALADASDPTIGLFAGQGPPPNTYDPHAVFCFENQLPTLLEEELALLRGRDDVRPPDFNIDGVRVATVYNRLPWNFTSGDGQVAYANNYQVTGLTDIDLLCGTPGHDFCGGARDLYPQGHGDAWGHYLTAFKKFLTLLQHPAFEWVESNEAVLVGGQPVDVSFEYERKFAQIAAAKARAGAAVTSLTFRELYDADPSVQNGYPDDDMARSWGVVDWAKRTGMGAYFDWAITTAILDDADTDPSHTNTIRKVDRTTVPELGEIAHSFLEIQSTLDEADAGLNPLGLALNVVPFGLNPTEIEQGKTHFDQVYERALAALRSAVTAFNFANQNTQRLRTDQDEAEGFSQLVAERERDFNARLIEVFGKPYPEDIGPGRSYVTGYDGPDFYHFGYVEPTELVGQTRETRTITVSRQFVERVIDLNGVVTQPIVTIIFNVSTDGVGIIKPVGWSARPEPGEVQLARSELLQTLGRYLQALEQFEALLDQIDDQVRLLASVHQVNTARLAILSATQQQNFLLNAEIAELRKDQLQARRDATVTRGLADGYGEVLPRVNGLDNDYTSVARGLFKVIGAGIAYAFDASADLSALTELRREQAQQLLASQTQIDIADLDGNQRVNELATALRQLVRSTPALRIEIYTTQEAIHQATGRYQSAIGKGLRLLDERTAFRQKSANQVSEYRYRDMAFRVFRNQALQKYLAQFDLAAQYAFLAARAYDYETSLLGIDLESGREFLTGLTRERVLGGLTESDMTPILGTGIAGQLASMATNWQAIKPQLGFNAPTEINRTFSLRWELFRLPNSVAYDAEWRQRLESFVITDLNAFQEYSQYCQPLQPPVPNNPALIIPFSTTVQSQLNLFGWPSTGDATLPSDRFAIKMHSYSVKFSNYPGFPLNRQVNIYLVPVGADVMRVPTCPVAPTRQWQLLDQTLPVPFPLSNADLTSNDWMPWDSISGGPASLVRRRLIPTVAACATDDTTCTDVSFKLTGRSIWNTRWLLVIPGSELQGSNPSNGVNVLIHGNTQAGTGIRDIKLIVKAYGYSGCVSTASESLLEPTRVDPEE